MKFMDLGDDLGATFKATTRNFYIASEQAKTIGADAGLYDPSFAYVKPETLANPKKGVRVFMTSRDRFDSSDP